MTLSMWVKNVFAFGPDWSVTLTGPGIPTTRYGPVYFRRHLSCLPLYFLGLKYSTQSPTLERVGRTRRSYVCLFRCAATQVVRVPACTIVSFGSQSPPRSYQSSLARTLTGCRTPNQPELALPDRMSDNSVSTAYSHGWNFGMQP